MKIIYIDNCIKNLLSKHLAPRFKNNAINKFKTMKKIYNILSAAYRNTNKKYTAQVKFQNLYMTKNFNIFWVKFLLLISELKAYKSIFIIEL